jgi:hypothetical protein
VFFRSLAHAAAHWDLILMVPRGGRSLWPGAQASRVGDRRDEGVNSSSSACRCSPIVGRGDSSCPVALIERRCAMTPASRTGSLVDSPANPRRRFGSSGRRPRRSACGQHTTGGGRFTRTADHRRARQATLARPRIPGVIGRWRASGAAAGLPQRPDRQRPFVESTASRWWPNVAIVGRQHITSRAARVACNTAGRRSSRRSKRC